MKKIKKATILDVSVIGDVDRESIKAKLDNGVLSIIVPKAKAEEQKKAIAIE